MTAQQWQTAEALFNAALDLPVEVRTEWVRAAGGDDSYLTTAVLRMLEADATPSDEIRRAVRSAVKDWIGK